MQLLLSLMHVQGHPLVVFDLFQPDSVSSLPQDLRYEVAEAFKRQFWLGAVAMQVRGVHES